MSEMIDRMTAALSAHLAQLAEGSAYFADGYSDGTVVFDGELAPQALVRHLLQAMREPTEAMLEAGPGEPYMDAYVWARIIDAACGTTSSVES